MLFPETSDALKAAGYQWQNDGVCKGCGADIEWWRTPQGKYLPMDPMERGSSRAISHFATCSDTPLFRRNG